MKYATRVKFARWASCGKKPYGFQLNKNGQNRRFCTSTRPQGRISRAACGVFHSCVARISRSHRDHFTWVYRNDKPKFKKEAFASFRGISVFSPSVYRTSAAEWGQGWRGNAGRRSSWGHLPFYICRSVQAWGSGYCQYMPILPSGRKYPQNLPRAIDTNPVLWYPIIKPLPKGA